MSHYLKITISIPQFSYCVFKALCFSFWSLENHNNEAYWKHVFLNTGNTNGCFNMSVFVQTEIWYAHPPVHLRLPLHIASVMYHITQMWYWLLSGYPWRLLSFTTGQPRGSTITMCITATVTAALLLLQPRWECRVWWFDLDVELLQRCF